MVNDEEIVVQLTREDCEKIIQYVQWLEEKADNHGYDIGEEYSKTEESIQKIIDGKFK